MATAVEREHAVEQVFAHARLQELFARPWSTRDLVDFHTAHKLQLLTHGRPGYDATGRLVAQAGTRPADEVEATYRRLFARALAAPTSRGRVVDTLLHASGYLPRPARRGLTDRFEAYLRREVSQLAVVSLVWERIVEARIAYLMRQTFFAPYPPALWFLRDQI